ncbi:hypothetical protein VTJ49DRAFT_5024 [Mycothermus thermophilus]|uniref:Uncharacterized protein n=1 Tax=Humicola insolens TaxID=85995 RepID=A0ABR3V449_HUMIN
MEGDLSRVHDTEPPSVSNPNEPLSPSQLHALFDILTHHGTYAEVESFKEPGTISEYGHPFSSRAESSAPLLAGVLRSIVLPFPGIRDLPADFWQVRFQAIMETLAAAGLSESFDKGVMGTRKTLATAASSIHEAVSRGILGGVRQTGARDLHSEYDRSSAQDLERAWEDALHELVYGDLVRELFACVTDKKSPEEHSPGVRAAVDYIIIHLATFIHHVIVVSPEGPYLLKLLENVHKLLPYSLVKQTLRVSNAATMLNGMTRLFLAKLSVGAISNWVGLTQNAADGMNLLQRIIWMVLSWDALEFRKSADAIEKAKGSSALPKEYLAAIRDFVSKPKSEHDQVRKQSVQSGRSVVVTVLERDNAELVASLSPTHHSRCLEYLAALLSARDRDEIINSLCRQNPDLFTQAIRDAVTSFEPMIRTVHQQVDLREHVSAAEGFISEFISVSRGKKRPSESLTSPATGTKADPSDPQPPSVKDYVLLLQHNRHLLYNWLHQVASQCPELRDMFLAWAEETIKLFRQPPELAASTASGHPNPNQRPGAAGKMSDHLQTLFASLPTTTQSRLLPIIDAHAAYLSRLEALSRMRMQRILDNLPPPTPPLTSSNAISPPASPSPSSPPPSPPTAPTPSYLSPSSLFRSGWTTPRSRSRSPTPTPTTPSAPPLASTNTTTTTTTTNHRSSSGPGIYLARWQHLLDTTLITPATPSGPFRTGRDVYGALAKGKTGAGSGSDSGRGTGKAVVDWGETARRRRQEEEEEEMGMEGAVDVREVVEALGEGFKRAVAGLLVEGGRG